jgi:hypothetical protein
MERSADFLNTFFNATMQSLFFKYQQDLYLFPKNQRFKIK